MEKYFITNEGDRVNIIDHTIEQLNKWPNLKLYIGTDSQCIGDRIHYVTTVVYRYDLRGAHFIYLRSSTEKDCDKSQFLRLYSEGSKTLELESFITSNIPISIEAIEFDYSDISKTLSTKLVSVFKGMSNAVFKSGDMIACKAADHILRHPGLYK
jgi:predicted RNase H-related nuclease YkuK (DUF458 family)